jgi:hypothetical protein
MRKRKRKGDHDAHLELPKKKMEGGISFTLSSRCQCVFNQAWTCLTQNKNEDKKVGMKKIIGFLLCHFVMIMKSFLDC